MVTMTQCNNDLEKKCACEVKYLTCLIGLHVQMKDCWCFNWRCLERQMKGESKIHVKSKCM